MKRLLRMTGLLGLVLGLMLLPVGCSGSEEETTSEPSPSLDPAWRPAEVEVSFATDSDGQFELSGEPADFGYAAERRPADSASTPGAESSLREVVVRRTIGLRVPARIDGVQARLTLTLHIDDETRVLDRSGNEIPLSQPRSDSDYESAWTATVRADETRHLLYALDLRQVKRPDSALPPPVVTGLLAKRADGLLDVPGEPSFVDGKGLFLMDQDVVFDGGWAMARCSLAVDRHSKVITTRQRQGSKDELLRWVNKASWDYDWQATARLKKDGTLTLVKLVGSAPPGI